MNEKTCIKCGVSSNNAKFEYILNTDGTPKSYRSRCYNCRHPDKKELKQANIINNYSISVNPDEYLEPVNKIEINDLDYNIDDNYCYYTGVLLNNNRYDKYSKKEMILNNKKRINVCLAIELLKGSMSDRDFNKIINYLKIFEKSRKRKIILHDNLSDNSKEYLTKLSTDNNDLDIEQIRINQGDCCYLSGIRMIWDKHKWHKGIIYKNDENEYCLVIPLFSKLKKIMNDNEIKELLKLLRMTNISNLT